MHLSAKLLLIVCLFCSLSAEGRLCRGNIACDKDLVAQVKITGKDRKLCDRLLRSSYEYVNFAESTNLNPAETKEYIRKSTLAWLDNSGEAGGAASIDINNDGAAERIVELKLYSGASSGCDREYYAEVNQTGTSILVSPLTSSLNINHKHCHSYVHAFIFEGAIYLELASTKPYPGSFVGVETVDAIVRINGKHSSQVCAFRLPK